MPEHESGVAQEWATERQHTVKDGIHSHAMDAHTPPRAISPPQSLRAMTPRSSLAHQIYPPRFTTPQDVYRSMAPATPRNGDITPRHDEPVSYMPPLEPGHIVI